MDYKWIQKIPTSLTLLEYEEDISKNKQIIPLILISLKYYQMIVDGSVIVTHCRSIKSSSGQRELQGRRPPPPRTESPSLFTKSQDTHFMLFQLIECKTKLIIGKLGKITENFVNFVYKGKASKAGGDRPPPQQVFYISTWFRVSLRTYSF